MIRYFSHNELDKEQWNSCVRASRYPTVFADFDFLTVAAPDWGALVEDDYSRVMPLPSRSKLSVDYIFTPYGFVRLGIFSPDTLSESCISDFISAIPENFKQVDLFLNPEISCSSVKDFSVEMVSHKLDLSKDYDEIYRSFSENTRRNIKKAEKSDLTLTTEISVSEIIDLFKHNKGSEKHINASDSEYALFEVLAEDAVRRGWTETIGAKDREGRIVAGAIFLKDYDVYRFWFSGRDFRHSEARPLFFLMNEFIKRHAGESAILDFDGSRDENVARFYRGFGGEKFTFPMLNYSQGRCFSKLMGLYRMFFKH